MRHEVEGTGADAIDARHFFWKVDAHERIEHTAGIVAAASPTIIFCKTRHGVDRLARHLEHRGMSVAPIHGGRSQVQRDRALGGFIRGQVQALVATDVAARGIHVDGVACVVHFDPPTDAKDYMHRSGRTARVGASGVVVSLVSPDQVPRVAPDAGPARPERRRVPRRPGEPGRGRGAHRPDSGPGRRRLTRAC